jgi:beta-glucosidase
MDRRTMLKSIPAALLPQGHAVLAAGATAGAGTRKFPANFLWGAATAGYQVEGNNVNADIWLLEHVKPTIFAEPSGDACDSFALWQEDLGLVRGLGLNAYRFSLEWARIEPAEGKFSRAMLDHYKRMIEACRASNVTPVVTFNHFACPIWFAARGGWTASDAPGLYARYCERAARHLGAAIGFALTFNEPNIMQVLRRFLPSPEFVATRRAMLTAAGQATGSQHFVTGLVANDEDVDAMLGPMIAAHKQSYQAIKSVHPGLPVGASISISDDQAVGSPKYVEEKRQEVYSAWLEALRATGDFIGVQNYDRTLLGANGVASPPAGARLTQHGVEIYPDALGNAVRYVHHATGKPIIVTENGLDSKDDTPRAAYIPAALSGLHRAIADGIPVLGYLYWSLLDNYEWSLGYAYQYGLFEVDRETFRRSRKPSATVLSEIATRNALPAQ